MLIELSFWGAQLESNWRDNPVQSIATIRVLEDVSCCFVMPQTEWQNYDLDFRGVLGF